MAPARSLALALALPAIAAACTYFEIATPAGEWVAGRTMELGQSGGGLLAGADGGLPTMEPWRIVVHPRGPAGGGYGYLTAEAASSQGAAVADGMNEAGLSVSLQTMRMAGYQEPDPAKDSVFFGELVPWMLARFDSVETVRQGLANVSVVNKGLGRGDFAHWAVADAKGDSVVVEYVDGKLQVHKNDVRVMTNDPDYQWHLKNLNMYVGLLPNAPVENDAFSVKTEVGQVPQVWSQGFSLLGLPGDFSPASRFVRMFYLRRYAEVHDPVTSVDDAMVLATGLLNNVFIPRGAVAPMQPAKSIVDYDFTNWGLIKIPAQRRFIFRDYRSMVWKEIDLKQLKWDKERSIPVSDGSLGIEQVTGKLKGPMEELI